MNQSEINSLIRMQLDDMSSWEIFQYSLNGYGSGNTWSPANGFNSYVMQPDQNTVDKANALINKMLNGQTLTQTDVAE